MKDKLINVFCILFAFTMFAISAFMVSDFKRKEEIKRMYIDVKEEYKKINLDELIEIYNRDELSFIYIGKDNCSYCQKQNKIFYEILKDYKFDIYYLDINKETSEDLLNKLAPLNEDFSKNGIGTPTLMLVKNKSIIMYKRGLTSKDNLVGLLKQNSFI